jgi:hypothetical protein
VKILIFRFPVHANAAFTHISTFTMPRKDRSSIPSTTASGSQPAKTATSKPAPSGQKRASFEGTDSTIDSLGKRTRGRKSKHNVSVAEPMEELVKRRAVASALDGSDQHSQMRLENDLHVNKNAISKHKAAVESLIMSHEGDFRFELPEDRTAWGFRASVTNDQEAYYPGFFAVHIAPEADKKASKVSNSLPVTP